MAAKISVLGLILSSFPYLRSAMVRFPFIHSFINRLIPPLSTLMKRSGLRLELFCLKIVLNQRSGNFFLTDFFLLYLFTLFLRSFCPHFPKFQCPNFLNIQNPWGKVMERSGIRFEHFGSKMV